MRRKRIAHIKGVYKKMSEDIPEGVVNLLEMIVRCYDC